METTTGRSTGVLSDSDDSAVAASGEPGANETRQPIPAPSHQSPLRKHQPHFA
jgi:hypothetical protein